MVVLLGWLTGWPAFAQSLSMLVSTGAPSAWVIPLASNAADGSLAESAASGQIYRLYDEQVNVATAETYDHVEAEIISENGVQQGGNLVFSFDPSYQTLEIHQIVIHRDGQTFDRLDPAKFKMIQQETDLNRQIYNGTVSAVLFLEDVRVGDRIEYSITIRGQNPAFKKHYSKISLTRFMVPVSQWHLRLLWPSGRTLHYQSRGAEITPVVANHPDFTEYLWDQSNLPPVDYEEQTPSWYPVFPWIQLSDFENWHEVSSWAGELFQPAGKLSPALQERASSLKLSNQDTDGMIQAALDFVQKDIRYLGIEWGPNSYHPTDPATVLARRFGDCKDKAVLLCALLHGMDIQAVPVLVSTTLRKSLSQVLPAPDVFNHAIVHVLGSREYWIDPTSQYQSGPVIYRYLPDYYYGMEIQPDEAELTRIPLLLESKPTAITTEQFQLGGQQEPARLKVYSLYLGGDADYLRTMLAVSGQAALAKDYLNDYAQRYPGVAADGILTVQDSTNADKLLIIHNYVISHFWKLTSDQQKYTGSFYPLAIHSWIMRPPTALRKMPLELSYPRERVVRTLIDLPRFFRLSNYTNTISGPECSLSVERVQNGTNVALTYVYQSLSDYVPVSKMAAHLDSLDRMENELGYQLTWQNPAMVSKTSKLNWPVIGLTLVYGLLLAGVAIGLVRRPVASMQPVILNEADAALAGLGGWLVIVGIKLVMGALIVLSTILTTGRAFSLPVWQTMTTLGSQFYQPWWGVLIVFELLCQMTALALCLTAGYLFFNKRKLFTSVMKFYLLFILGFMVVDHVLASTLIKSGNYTDSAKANGKLFGNLLGCIIWIAYLRSSRRVKATFIR